MNHFKTLTMVSMETNVTSRDSFLDKLSENFTWMDSKKGNRVSVFLEHKKKPGWDKPANLQKLLQNQHNSFLDILVVRLVEPHDVALLLVSCFPAGFVLEDRWGFEWGVFTKFGAKSSARRTNWRAVQLAFIMYGGRQRRKLGGLCGRKKGQYYLAIAFVSSLGTLKNELMQISVGPRHNGVFLKKY